MTDAATTAAGANPNNGSNKVVFGSSANAAKRGATNMKIGANIGKRDCKRDSEPLRITNRGTSPVNMDATLKTANSNIGNKL